MRFFKHTYTKYDNFWICSAAPSKPFCANPSKKKGKKKLMVTTHCTMKRPTTHTRIFLKKILALQSIYSYNKRYKLILSFSWKKKEDFWHINFPCQNRTNLFHTKGFSVAADDWIHLLQPLHFGGLCPRIHSSWKDASELWWWQQY